LAPSRSLAETINEGENLNIQKKKPKKGRGGVSKKKIKMRCQGQISTIQSDQVEGAWGRKGWEVWDLKPVTTFSLDKLEESAIDTEGGHIRLQKVLTTKLTRLQKLCQSSVGSG